MKIIITYFVVLAIGIMHPLKMSNSKLTIENDIAKVEMRIFLDDLTFHIQQKYRIKRADFSTLESYGALALQRYINDCFYLTQNDKNIHFKIEKIDFTENNIALIVYLRSVTNVNANDPIKAKNTMMFDIFKKQENLIRFKTTGNQLKIISHKIDKPIQELQ